jgi:1-pyrroline-5-carboxylate dehydrogenase
VELKGRSLYGKKKWNRKYKNMTAPHDHKHIVGTYHLAEKSHVEQAIANRIRVQNSLGKHGLGQRAAIFLKSS